MGCEPSQRRWAGQLQRISQGAPCSRPSTARLRPMHIAVRSAELVPADSPEYRKVLQLFASSFPASRIVHVQRVVNDDIACRFAKRRRELGQAGVLGDLVLFSGTTADAIDEILADGYGSMTGGMALS